MTSCSAKFLFPILCSDSGGGVQEDDPGVGKNGGRSAAGSDILLYDVTA